MYPTLEVSAGDASLPEYVTGAALPDHAIIRPPTSRVSEACETHPTIEVSRSPAARNAARAGHVPARPHGFWRQRVIGNKTGRLHVMKGRASCVKRSRNAYAFDDSGSARMDIAADSMWQRRYRRHASPTNTGIQPDIGPTHTAASSHRYSRSGCGCRSHSAASISRFARNTDAGV